MLSPAPEHDAEPRPETPLDDWIKRARSGDARAFNRLVECHQALAYHVAVHHTGSAEDARDACQEAMLSAWRAMPRFQGGARPFRAWLMRIVTNSAIDRRRHASRIPLEALDQQPDGRPRALPDPGESPERFAERHDLGALLQQALLQLSDAHRAVILLHQAGFDYADIASTLEIEIGTVKSRLCRARVHLRGILLGVEDGRAAMEPGRPAERWNGEPPAARLPRSANPP